MRVEPEKVEHSQTLAKEMVDAPRQPKPAPLPSRRVGTPVRLMRATTAGVRARRTARARVVHAPAMRTRRALAAQRLSPLVLSTSRARRLGAENSPKTK